VIVRVEMRKSIPEQLGGRGDNPTKELTYKCAGITKKNTHM
jgi:hypothetical protein